MTATWRAAEVPVLNRYDADIPAYAVVEATGLEDDGRTVGVTRPESGSPQAVLVTGATPIAKGKRGTAFEVGGCPVFVSGEVEAREACGPSAGSFMLSGDGGPWVSLGVRAGLTLVSLVGGVGGVTVGKVITVTADGTLTYSPIMLKADLSSEPNYVVLDDVFPAAYLKD